MTLLLDALRRLQGMLQKLSTAHAASTWLCVAARKRYTAVLVLRLVHCLFCGLCRWPHRFWR